MRKTVMAALDECVEANDSRAALKVKRGARWATTTWREYRSATRRTARAFMALGLEAGDGLAIVGQNCPEWLFAALGAIHAGGHPAGIYTSSAPEQAQYIIDNAGATIVVAENAELLERIRSAEGGLPGVRASVLMRGHHEGEDVHSWGDLSTLADEIDGDELQARIEHQEPDDVCTLIYTSGTTSRPKGVMLSHDNLLWNAANTGRLIHASAEDHLICYLPLSHVAEQALCLYLPLSFGCSVWFAESLEKLADNLREVRPSLFLSVPRLWEKIQAKITAVGAESKGLKKAVAQWARRVGLEGGLAEDRGEPRPLLLGLADRIVFSKVRAKLGLDHARMLATGTAPISRSTLEFFMSLGMPLYGVYGLTETTGQTTLGVAGANRLGTVGRPLPGTELKLAPDGEICVKGRHIFKGYKKDEEATKASFDEDGWYLTGDVGVVDDDGFLTITDRKREVIVTSGGKNVAPQMVEAKLKGIHGVGQAVVIGDRRKLISALLCLDPESLVEIAAEAGSSAESLVDGAACPKVNAWMQEQVDGVNRTLSHVEAVKCFRILPEELTVEGGELTPTLKLKRRVIHEKYAALIEEMYRD